MKKQILATSIVLGAAALVLSSGTMAYFTDTTNEIKNTFTVGKVDIELTETTDWSKEEDHILLPGGSYAKDPTVTLSDDSVESYVAVNITFNNASQYIKAVTNLNKGTGAHTSDLPALIPQFVEGLNLSDYETFTMDPSKLSKESGDSLSFTAMLKDKMSAGDSKKIFNAIKVPKEVTSGVFAGTDFSGSTVTVKAAAIQADNITKDEAKTQLENLLK